MCKMYAGQDRARYEVSTRRVRLNGQSTSVRLEMAFWQIIDRIAEQEGLSTPAFMSRLHAEALELHGEPANFSSLLRCTALIHIEGGHATPLRLMAAE